MNVRTLPVARALAVAALIGAAAPRVLAGGLQPRGGEYQLTRGVLGDQVNPGLVLNGTGGWLVWQDAAIDGDGLGIAAARLAGGGSTGTGAGVGFRVNQSTAGDQENPVICRLGSDRLLVAWQGGSQGFQRVFGRVISSEGAFVTSDMEVSSASGEHQIDPVAARLTDGSAVVVWSSYRQDGSFGYDIYARRVSADGQLLGDEFKVNATSGMNRRSPAVTDLPNGGFMIGWISERQAGVRTTLSSGNGLRLSGGGAPVYEVSLVVRSFGADGEPVGLEQKISDPEAVASLPMLATLADGRVLAAWTRRDPENVENRLDVASRLLNTAGIPLGEVQIVNDTRFGDQFRPRLSVTRHGVLGVWSSMGQDGSWEGVYGRWIDNEGTPSGDEIPINGQTGGGQLMPAVAADSLENLMVAWSTNLPRIGYEVFAQRFAPLLLRAEAIGDGQMKLSWPTVLGGVYRVQSSRDGRAWSDVGGSRTALAETDSLDITLSGQVVLYRVVRAR